MNYRKKFYYIFNFVNSDYSNILIINNNQKSSFRIFYLEHRGNSNRKINFISFFSA